MRNTHNYDLNQHTIKFLSIGVVALLICASYSRFIIYSEVYRPLFLAAFDNTLFEYDIYVRDHFMRHAAFLFYVSLEQLGKMFSGVDATKILYGLFLCNNIFGLWVIYRFGRQLGNKVYALFLLAMLFSPFEFLRGADVSVIYSHQFSPTAFAFPFAVYSIALFLEKRYVGCLVALFCVSAINVKTGFAVGLPIIGVMSFSLLRDREDRRHILKAGILLSPFFVGFAGFVLFGRDSVSNCAELIEMMIWREGDEADILLNMSYIRGRPYYYFLINLVAIYVTSNNIESQHWRQVRRLLITGNILLGLGIVISLISTELQIWRQLMLLPWPKLAVVPTLLSIAVVCKFVLEKGKSEVSWPRAVGKGLLYGSLFLALLNVDLLDERHQLLRWGLVMALLVAGLVRSREIHLQKVFLFLGPVSFTIMLLTGTQVAIAGFNASNIYKKGSEQGWAEPFFRAPGSFKTSQWDVSKWLNLHAQDGRLAIYLKCMDDDTPCASNMRRYSIMPMYVTGKPSDVYGSCSRKEEVERREENILSWIHTGNNESLRSERVGWVIIKERDIARIKDSTLRRVYQNDEFSVLTWD
jgi:hypothetical protein